MNMNRVILAALTVCMLLFLVQLLTVGTAMASSTYTSVYTGQVDSGSTINANNCFVRFDLVNGSSSAHVTVRSPNNPQQEVTISPDQSYFYYNVLKVYVAEINFSANKILVDISKPEGTGDGDTAAATQTGTVLSSETPGLLALAGDTVVFPITIQNNNNIDKTYTLSTSSDTDWDIKFMSGDQGIYRIFVPKMQSKTVNLVIKTTGSSAVGEKKVTAKADDKSIDVSVYITSVNQSADVAAKVTSKIASIGDKIDYDISIKNLQTKENLYKLSVTGLPDNWYYQFKENAGDTNEIAESVIPASSEKNLVIEIVPPYSVSEGDYNFTATVTTPEGTVIARDFTLKLKSSVSMSMTSSKLAYEAKPGEQFPIDVYVTNTGNGAALTNVFLDIKAPTGWLIQVTPNQTNSIKAGGSQTFRVQVTPPGNLVASDYDITIMAKSDQAEKEKDYRVTITVDSYIPYIGAATIGLVLVGLVLIYTKYGRR